MAASQNATFLADLIDPQVLADYIEQKLIKNIVFAPLAKIDRTLTATAGSTLTFPAYTYIGAAEAVAEGTDIPISKLGATTKEVKVSKIGRAVEFTDEAQLSGYGDIVEEATSQIVKSIADGVEDRLLTAMDNVTTLTHTIAAGTGAADGIADALTKFKEDIAGPKVIVIPNTFYASIRKANGWIPGTEIAADAIIRGTVGMIHGCQIAVSDRMDAVPHYAKTSDVALGAKTYYTFNNKTNAYTAVATADLDVDDIGTYYEKTTGSSDTIYIVKPGALRIVMKRDTLVEFDRDKLAQTNFIIGSKLFAPYVYDERKIIKVTLGS